MVGLFPVFGLIILTIEWMIFRRWALRLGARSVAVRALLGGLAGLALSLVVGLLGLALLFGTAAIDPPATVKDVVSGAGAALWVTGFIFSPIAAAFGAVLVAVERYRADEPPPPPPPPVDTTPDARRNGG